MASAAGFLRNFAETITSAIADSDAEIRQTEDKLTEMRAENDRLRKLALADGIQYGASDMLRLVDGTASRDDEEQAA